MEKLEPLYTAGRKVTGIVTLENSLMVPQKVKYRVAIWPSNFPPSYTPKRTVNMCPHKNLYMNAPSSIIPDSPKWRQSKNPTADGWINKMGYFQTVKYYSAIKRSEILTRVTAWVNPENMLWERSQSQRTMYRMILFVCNVQNRHIHRNPREGEGMMAKGYGFSFGR